MKVAWKPPGAHKVAITSYRVTLTPRGGGQTLTTITEAHRAVLRGAHSGTTYIVTVRAANRAGSGRASSTTVIPIAVPASPALSVSAGQGTLSARWSAPGSDGGSPVTGYLVKLVGHPASQGGQAQQKLLPPTATTYQVSGLADGTRYTVLVLALNAAGHSRPARRVAEPAGPPGAPTALQVKPGDGFLALRWKHAAANGSAVTGYSVTATPSGGGTSVSTTARGGSVKLAGLTNGTVYSVTVTAQSSAGSGPASAPVSGTPATKPGPPSSLTVTAGNGSLSASWGPPAQDGGAPVTGYEVRLVTHGASPKTTLLPATATTFSATDLTDGVPYAVLVMASNAAGHGQPARQRAVPSGPPPAPSKVTVKGLSGTVNVHWAHPKVAGSRITGYSVTATPASGPAVTVTASGTSATLRGLKDGTPYRVVVQAEDPMGRGAPSTPVSVTPAGRPGAPGGLTLSPGPGSLSVSWSPPTGSAPTGYLVTLHAKGSAPVHRHVAGTTKTFTGLSAGTRYTVTVAAADAAGHGPAARASVTLPG